MKRDASIESYRILLMFGIVLLHAAGKGVIRAPWLGNLLKFCVTGFVFISGYFGIRFSWGKLAKLYLLAAWCALLGSLFSISTSDSNICIDVLAAMKRYWFLHAYAILMMFSPVLNKALDAADPRNSFKLFLPLMILVYGWSYGFEIAHFRPFVFPSVGLGAHTFLTLIGVYAVGRLFAQSRFEVRITTRISVAAVMLCIPFAVVGLAPYNSVFAVIMAAGLFVLFKRFVSWQTAVHIAPSMFAVYLLHETDSGGKFIREVGVGLVARGVPELLMFPVVALSLFLMCLTLDLLRRCMLRWLRSLKNEAA